MCAHNACVHMGMCDVCMGMHMGVHLCLHIPVCVHVCIVCMGACICVLTHAYVYMDMCGVWM